MIDRCRQPSGCYWRPHQSEPCADRHRLPPQDDAPLGWFWVMLLVGVVACLCLFSCSAPDLNGKIETVQTASQAYQLAADSRPTPFGMCEWSEPKAIELSHRFHIPPPVTIFVPDRTPVRVVTVFDMPVAILYRLGDYGVAGPGVIQVWMLNWDGEPFTACQIQQTWKHEYVHHYDACNGIPNPEGEHNELFEFRIRELGL